MTTMMEIYPFCYSVFFCQFLEQRVLLSQTYLQKDIYFVYFWNSSCFLIFSNLQKFNHYLIKYLTPSISMTENLSYSDAYLQYNLILKSMNQNKLDLIFEKQPPEVQRKLMGLLIQYDAVMQYNKDQDKFEVDLLLPFRDVNQKEQFVSNFISRKSNAPQNTYSENPHQIEKDSENNQDHNHGQILNDSLIKSSNGEISEIGGDRNSVRDKSISKNRKLSANLSSRGQRRNRKYSEKESSKDRQQELSLNFTNQLDSNSKKQLSEIEFGINFSKIAKLINKKIENAVEQIKSSNYVSEGPIHSHRQESLHKISNLPQEKILFEIENARPYQSQRQNFSAHERSYHNYTDYQSQKSSEIYISEGIVDEHHSFGQNSEKSPKAHNESSHLMQNYSSFDYPEIKEDQAEDEEEQAAQKMNMEQYKKRQNVAISEIKQKLNKKYHNGKTHQRKNSSKIKQKYADFLKKNHKDINRLYDNIRKDIKRNSTKLTQIRKKDPILVLEDDVQNASSEEDRVFNQQMIQQYSQHIIAQNENMSSEDLIRYFRYLVQNARSLYIKHITKSR